MNLLNIFSFCGSDFHSEYLMCTLYFPLITLYAFICQDGRREVGQIFLSHRPNQVEGYVEKRTESKNLKIRIGRRRDRQTDTQTYEHEDKRTDEQKDVTTKDGCIIDILV